MRSRYSAFALADADYLLRTWHPSTRPSSLDLASDGVEWLRLEVRATDAGGAEDDAGTVEFVAHYWIAATRERGQQHEISRFRRLRGQWFYVGPAS